MKREEKLKYDFMPAAIEVIERPISPVGPFIIWLLFSLVLAILLWSIFGKIDQIVIARGIIVPEEKVAKIQSLETGKVSELLVEEGQKVKEGQLLVKLDPNLKEIDKQSVEANLNKLLGEKLAIESISQNKSLTIPEDLSLTDSEIKALENYRDAEINSYQLQLASLEEQKKSTNQKLSDLQNESEKIDTNIDTLKVQQSEQMSRLKATEGELQQIKEKLSNLSDGAVVQKDEINSLSKQDSELKSYYSSYADSIEQIKLQLEKAATLKAQYKNNRELLTSNLEEIESRINVLKSQRESQLSQLLIEKETEIQKFQADLNRTSKSMETGEIKASSSGVINNLSDFNKGSIISPGQVLMEIVPSEAALFVKADVLNKDVGSIKNGQSAEVKVDAFPPRTYGTLTGNITNISANSVVNKQLGMVFRTEVSLENNKALSNKKGVFLQSGMEVTVEIKTGKKSIIEVILQPLFSHFDEGIQLR